MDNKSLTLSDSKTGPNGGEDPATQRAQIARTRDEMGATIAELHGRLNPVVLKEQALEQFHEATETVKEELKVRLQEAKQVVLEEIDTVKTRVNEELVQAKSALREATIGKVENMMHQASDRVRGAGSSIRDVVVENPVPAALAGLGLAWLFVEGRRRRTSRSDERLRQTRMIAEQSQREDQIVIEGRPGREEEGEERTAGRKIREVAEQTGRKVSGATRDAASAVQRVASEAKESVSGVAQRAQDSATEISHEAREKARRVRSRSNDFYRSNPIAVGAAMLTAGTIIGLAVPKTNVEDQWMGRTRDDMVGKAQELTHEAFEKAGEAVKRMGSEDEDKGSVVTSSGERPRRDDLH